MYNLPFQYLCFELVLLILIFRYLLFFASSLMYMSVFLPCGQPAPDMSLLLVHIQHLPGLRGQHRIQLAKPFCHIFMYRRFGNSKFFCCLSHCRIFFDNIIGYLYSSLLDIILQGWSPETAVFTMYAEVLPLMFFNLPRQIFLLFHTKHNRSRLLTPVQALNIAVRCPANVDSCEHGRSSLRYSPC